MLRGLCGVLGAWAVGRLVANLKDCNKKNFTIGDCGGVIVVDAVYST